MKVSSHARPGGKTVSDLQVLIENATGIANKSGLAKGDGFISNSYLGLLMALLDGENHHYGSEEAFAFGVELHFRLKHLGKKKDKTFDKEDEKKLNNMVKCTLRDPFIKDFLKGAVRERVTVRFVGTQKVKVILDVRKRRKALDYKSTSCTTQAEFERAVVKYHYPRQCWMYSQAEKINEFIFVGIGKKECAPGKHPIFIVNMKDKPDLLRQGCIQYNHLVFVYQALKRYYAYKRGLIP